ncbi:transcriptional regulator, AraC family with amidase-like domain [Franzmannia pantelleriensis]|uniref:Transcriptional regulator, AraC family with amidase-like domain n=1 Tax=Franzmannia pantelleriensis TaxID=48727 RepID=A0A1G9NFU3_9GAMM|nr:GlxA family transcriptional regulator [Halomonas pantelleriensis]SDL85263.1 transcriptional regulator, AraC family with amidase-like domain [Halomonas pantelleriensis]
MQGHGKPPNGRYDVGFLMVPGFSQLAFSSTLEPLRMANHLADRELYRWHLISRDGAPVTASSGLTSNVDHGLERAPTPDLLLVCAGVDVQRHCDRATLTWLKRLAARRIPLGAVCTGGYMLAQAGLLDGYRCTLHWEHISSIHEARMFPAVTFSSQLFVMDRDRYTCSGGIAPLDMMLNLIGRQQGLELAEAIAEEFIHERIRGVGDRQRTPLRVRLGHSHPKLEEVATLMEANLQEPLSLDELASYADLSRRQLERLFQRYVDCPPLKYYLELRLVRARLLLRQTHMPITDVAHACGFISPPHFTKCYHDRFGHSPSRERKRRSDRQAEAEALQVASLAVRSAPDEV